jgi:hypothetical protein
MKEQPMNNNAIGRGPMTAKEVIDRQAEVPEQLARITMVSERMYNLVQELESKVAPLITPIPEENMKEHCNPKPVMCSVASQIYEGMEGMLKTCDKLQQIISRIQL